MPTTAANTSPRTLRALSVALATLASITGWILIEEVIGLDLRSPVLGDGRSIDIGLLEVTVTSLLTALGAWGALVVLERWTRRPKLIWTILVSVGLVASFVPLIVGADLEWEGRVGLGFLHGLVGASVIVGMRPTIADAD